MNFVIVFFLLFFVSRISVNLLFFTFWLFWSFL